MGVIDACEPVAHVGEPAGHRLDVELVGLDFAELVPIERRGDRRPRPRPNAVRRGDRAIASVLVVVDEYALAALLLPPLRRHPGGHLALELSAECDRRVPDVGESPARLDPYVDVNAAAAGCLR